MANAICRRQVLIRNRLPRNDVSLTVLHENMTKHETYCKDASFCNNVFDTFGHGQQINGGDNLITKLVYASCWGAFVPQNTMRQN